MTVSAVDSDDGADPMCRIREALTAVDDEDHRGFEKTRAEEAPASIPSAEMRW